ncbi:MAG: SH3 domain-containing protein [Prochlorococcaceae cyanobacterium]
MAIVKGNLPVWRWAALLGLALLAPADLPAGGLQRRLPEVRRRQAGDPLLTTGRCVLHRAPDCQAPSLVEIPADSRLDWLRTWEAPGGQRWLQVAALASGRIRRGWVLG